MKLARYLAALAVVVLALSCAQPPKAEVDTARAKVAAAQKDADVLTYAADSLQQAKDALARMEKSLQAKKYPEAKASAIQAASLADGAAADVAPAKEKAKTDATALIAEGKKQVAALQPLISVAKKSKPKGLDLLALDKDFAAARTQLASADSAFGIGNFGQARDSASAAKASLSEIEKRISDAIQLSRKKK